MNASTCTEATTPPTVTFRFTGYHAGRTLILTVINGAWHWRIDEPNARNSSGYPSHPAAKAVARAALGLSAIGEAGRHLTPDTLCS